MILDLYSRYVVGWMVSVKENAGLAKILFANAIKHHGIAAEQLTVHQDRGAPMTANTFRELLGGLGIEQSYSRPRVSNDNAHSESHSKRSSTPPVIPESSLTPRPPASGSRASSIPTISDHTRAYRCTRRSRHSTAPPTKFGGAAKPHLTAITKRTLRGIQIADRRRNRFPL